MEYARNIVFDIAVWGICWDHSSITCFQLQHETHKVGLLDMVPLPQVWVHVSVFVKSPFKLTFLRMRPVGEEYRGALTLQAETDLPRFGFQGAFELCASLDLDYQWHFELEHA